jgi:hypothetical protein
MRKVPICLLSLLAAACEPPGEELAADEQAIVNGTDLPDPAAYGIVKLVVHWPIQGRPHGCTGTLLNNEWVLTAAHCFEDAQPLLDETGLDPVGLVLEPNTRTGVFLGAERREIAAVYHHDARLDVSLVRLDAPMPMAGRWSGHERRVHTGGKPALLGQTLTCFGFGATSLDDKGFGAFRSSSFWVTDVSRPNHFDLAAWTPGVVLWNGDSGGPCLDAAGTIAGVLSVGDHHRFREVFAGDLRAWVHDTMAAYGRSERIHDFACVGAQECQTGDIDGDGDADLIVFDKGAGAAVWTMRNDAGRFAPGLKAHDHFCQGSEDCRVADMDGDGRDDLVAFVKSTQPQPYAGDVWVAWALGDGRFSAPAMVHDWFCVGNETCQVGDVTGDGRADLVAVTHPLSAPSDVWVSRSFWFGMESPATVWSHEHWTRNVRVADMNGDGIADLVGLVQHPWAGLDGMVEVALSDGWGFAAKGVRGAAQSGCRFGEVCELADVDGDRRADVISFSRGSAADVHVSYGGEQAIGPRRKAHDFFCQYDEVCRTADVNGDGRADLLAFVRGTGGDWWVGDVWVALSQALRR